MDESHVGLSHVSGDAYLHQIAADEFSLLVGALEVLGADWVGSFALEVIRWETVAWSLGSDERDIGDTANTGTYVDSVGTPVSFESVDPCAEYGTSPSPHGGWTLRPHPRSAILLCT